MAFVFQFLSRWPLWLLHRLGTVCGWLVYVLSPGYRKRLQDHARQAGVHEADRRNAVAAAGRMVMELPRLWLGALVPVMWDGAHHIEQALAEQRGIIFLTPHLGSFEVTAQAYASRFGSSGAPMTVLYRPARQLWLRRIIEASRARPGLHTAPANLAGVKQLIKALRSGQCVGLLPDQVPPEGQGAWVPFFGRDAYTMTLAARLAQQTGARLVLAWGERLPAGAGYKVCVRPYELVLSLDLTEATAQINAAMEQVIRELPSQYLWGYARYKQPRRPDLAVGQESKKE
ncbi:lysophospholipid acyltransferase family protein [Rhodoferax mekongensis]|uniref:Lysophospholipid acyltransferase family protein n=1 Tax=Rhodoferax mekongensis TaxID=3068341 RepID=A0ABZ0B5K9_9BURK|nr:lysophospholipid acyltransferase family protein [Rhodoferax sp. TBRC 17307]WNO06167.1 lysophospholipid acyltransferase family protein [Rhodoferax sp. TBRC 17307]